MLHSVSMIIVSAEAIEKALNVIIDIVVNRYDELDMRASGKTADSLEARAWDNHGEIWGDKTFEYLAKGRPPSEKRPPVDAIFQWMLDKRSFTGPKTKSMAYAIATSIQQEGTSWHKQGGSDILEILLSDE